MDTLKRKAPEANLDESNNERSVRVKVDHTDSTQDALPPQESAGGTTVPQMGPRLPMSYPPFQQYVAIPPVSTPAPLQTPIAYFPAYEPFTFYPTPTVFPTVADPLGIKGTQTSSKKGAKPGPDAPRTKKFLRKAAGQVWEDDTLANWPKDDFRIFAGNLGNDVTDDSLKLAFGKYKTCTLARVVRDKRTGKSKGYGFVSFLDAHDFVRALKEMNGKYICNRPCKLTKSRWKDRNIDSEKEKSKNS